jgi:GWxTD domain-containing protein
VYREMGLIGGTGDLPFVGSVAHFAAATPDSTHVLLTLSLPNRALTFAREGDRYRASYHVRLDVRLDARRGAASVRQVATDEVVRVATFKETARTDESVLFYQWLTLAPGTYALSVAMRDAEGGRSSALDVPLEVPRLGPGAVSTPAAAYDVVPRARLDTLPRLAATARAAVTFGHDSLVPVYVEGYAAAPAVAPRLPLRVTARGERGVVLWTDTVALERGAAAGAAGSTQLYSGVVRVPVARLGIGVVTVGVERLDAAVRVSERVLVQGAPRDSARVALFVALGEDLPITSFDEVVSYLRYYATPERLRALRDTAPAARAVAWSAFLRDSDPVAATPEHEGLRDYFARIRAANVRFGEEGSAGWLTDRGMAYVGLGEPDQIFEPGGPDVNMRGRQQIWDYRTPRLQLVFTDQSGYGRWRLTSQSANEVQAAIRQRLVK